MNRGRTTYLNKISEGYRLIVADLESLGLSVSVKDSADGVRIEGRGNGGKLVRVEMHPTLLTVWGSWGYRWQGTKTEWATEREALKASLMANG